MKVNVTAVCFDTTDPLLRMVGGPRTEEIDTEENELFQDCANIQEVEQRYEAFWNYLNGGDRLHNPREKVKVLTVVPV